MYSFRARCLNVNIGVYGEPYSGVQPVEAHQNGDNHILIWGGISSDIRSEVTFLRLRSRVAVILNYG